MRVKWFLASAAAVLAASAVLSASKPVNAAPTETADIAHGKQVFVAIGCYQCHGYVGQGSQSTGPALVPLRLGDEAFVRYLRAPRGVMPAFSAKLLPAADARDVLGYVRSLSPGAPPGSIALLAPYVIRSAAPRVAAKAAAGPTVSPAPGGGALAEGGKLFAANCAGCHGAHLEGGAGPALRDEGARMSTEQIAAIIINPPPGMPKLSPAPLAAAQVKQVAAFVHEKH